MPNCLWQWIGKKKSNQIVTKTLMSPQKPFLFVSQEKSEEYPFDKSNVVSENNANLHGWQHLSFWQLPREMVWPQAMKDSPWSSLNCGISSKRMT